MPHLKVLIAEGALDVEVHFGEPITFSKGSNRKETSKLMESQVRAMMQAALADPLPSR
jgi:1-acyl-sn-glycerol-3-phosphate acyltransferase